MSAARKRPRKNVKTHARGCLYVIYAVILFFSGFFALGGYLMSYLESNFYRDSVLTQATVTGIHEEKFTESQSTGDGSNSRVNVEYLKVVEVKFRDKNGKVRTSRRIDGEVTTFKEGDQTEIYYDPDETSDIRFKKDIKNLSFLNNVWKVALGIFGFTLLVIWAFNFNGKRD